METTTGTVEATILKQGRKAIKLAGAWYGAWMENKVEPTPISTVLRQVQEGDYVAIGYVLNSRGYNDLTAIMDHKPRPASPQPAPIRGSDPRQKSIERQNASNAASRAVSAMIAAGLIPAKAPDGLDLDFEGILGQVNYALDVISEGRMIWLETDRPQ